MQFDSIKSGVDGHLRRGTELIYDGEDLVTANLLQ